MNLCQVYVFDIVRTVIVLDLSTSPVQTLDLDDLSVLDGAAEWDFYESAQSQMEGECRSTVRVPSVLQRISASSSNLLSRHSHASTLAPGDSSPGQPSGLFEWVQAFRVLELRLEV